MTNSVIERRNYFRISWRNGLRWVGPVSNTVDGLAARHHSSTEPLQRYSVAASYFRSAIPEKGRSQRILWLLEELGVDYEIKRYSRNPNTNLAPAELLAIHPLGKSPVITDDDLHPEKLKLAPGQFVAWISYASQPVRVVFEKDVAREMVCEHPMNFTLEDEGLRSDPLAPGEFASFCELRAGKFEYRVEPVSGKGDELEGELKVRER